MRIASLAVATFAGFTLASCITAGSGQLREGPFCAITNTGFDNVTENCYLPSFEACRREVIAGNRGHCVPNPRWVPPRQR
jgi:Protein of unknown function (DUF3551)